MQADQVSSELIEDVLAMLNRLGITVAENDEDRSGA
jgi:hypothetical protein